MRPPKFCQKCGTALQEIVTDVVKRLSCSHNDCNYIFYDNPTPVVGGIVEYEGKIILIQNQGWPKSWYGLVTGYLERNEQPELAMIRELKEELNLDGEIINFVGHYPFRMKNELCIIFHMKATGKLKMDITELADYKLLSLAELKFWQEEAMRKIGPVATVRAVKDWLDRQLKTTSYV